MAIVFDVETNGLLRQATKVHCICTYDTETKKATSYYGPSLTKGYEVLASASLLIGHNIIKYDLPVLKRITGKALCTGKLFDTYLVSTMLCKSLYATDVKTRTLPQNYWGKHSLAAWGYRLGVLKGDFGATTDWAEFSMDMLKYCEQDVAVTVALYQYLLSKVDSSLQRSLASEHQVWRIIAEQEEHGFPFDYEGASAFFEKLSLDIGQEKIRLRTLFPPRYKKQGVPVASKRTQLRKVNGVLCQYTEGALMQKVTLSEFNPCSGDDVAHWLIRRYNWKPSDFTETGKPKVTGDILSDLDYPEAQALARLQFLVKMASFLWGEKETGWLQIYDKETGCIHGNVNPNGAATSRMTHSSPNMAQVPSVKTSSWNPLRAEYGKLCRSFFKARDGYAIVGCDASSLELRCLAHYMAKYDGGAYVNTVVKGNKDEGTDIHTVNQRFAGLPTRDLAKTFIYALIYGAGDAKIGSIMNGGAKQGSAMKQRFLDGLPALKSLINDVQRAAKVRGYLRGIDGRIIAVESQHAALNRLLQSAGAIVMKYALINIDTWAKQEGIDFGFCANVHDEWQAEVRADQAQRFAELSVLAIEKATEDLDFRCPLTGEAHIGNTWADTH